MTWLALIQSCSLSCTGESLQPSTIQTPIPSNHLKSMSRSFTTKQSLYWAFARSTILNTMAGTKLISTFPLWSSTRPVISRIQLFTAYLKGAISDKTFPWDFMSKHPCLPSTGLASILRYQRMWMFRVLVEISGSLKKFKTFGGQMNNCRNKFIDVFSYIKPSF